jgi:hypothetical protein
MVRLIMCNLVDGENFPIVAEHHHSKHKRGYCLHSVHVAMSKQYFVIKWGIDNFNVYEDGFAPNFDGDILEESFRGGWSTIIGSQGDGRWYYLRGDKFFPYYFGHDTCGWTFINDTSMNYDVLNLNWYLESYQGREVWFSADESSINWVDFPQGRKQGFPLSWIGLEELQYIHGCRRLS